MLLYDHDIATVPYSFAFLCLYNPVHSVLNGIDIRRAFENRIEEESVFVQLSLVADSFGIG